ncbi:MAG: 16S rRNA (cytosine(1402)-N(4))-methyltransferase RsmH [Fibrobacter sp.]|jgi:16S rRNA (cytosine1402-N4)-methyltransferase|nr:16S rRNA (cytosine(1402)-N(4))-methyltransferase RsmH [Fibrobacter sp.]
MTVSYHEPVLLKESLDALLVNPSGVYADCTLGGGGHSFAILSRLDGKGFLHAFDRDLEAVHFAGKRLAAFQNFSIHAKPFSAIAEEIPAGTLSGVLYDLGVSSHQLDDSSRGFTFAGDNPLDLRMDRRETVSAQEWLRGVSAETLAKVFKNNSDLERSYKLALVILDFAADTDREILPQDIRAAVEKVFPDKRKDWNGILARVFQAIRMEVNEELLQIKESLTGAVACLVRGGRMVVISYHSVEDRCVKTTLAEFEKDCICPVELPVCRCGGKHRQLKKVFRKPVLPTSEEIARNSRARSAKLRVYERV